MTTTELHALVLALHAADDAAAKAREALDNAVSDALSACFPRHNGSGQSRTWRGRRGDYMLSVWLRRGSTAGWEACVQCCGETFAAGLGETPDEAVERALDAFRDKRAAEYLRAAVEVTR